MKYGQNILQFATTLNQACPWECHSYVNPMGNVPWDGIAWYRHKMLWDGNGTDNMSHGQPCIECFKN